jgi:hypothetical protein
LHKGSLDEKIPYFSMMLIRIQTVTRNGLLSILAFFLLVSLGVHASPKDRYCRIPLELVGNIQRDIIALAQEGRVSAFTLDTLAQTPIEQSAPPELEIDSLPLGRVITFHPYAPLLIRKVEGEYGLAVDPVGRSIYYRKEGTLFKRISPQSSPLCCSSIVWRAPEKTFETPSSKKALISDMAKRHLANSTTYASALRKDRGNMLAAQEEVLTDMLGRLAGTQALTLGLLRRWHRTVHLATPGSLVERVTAGTPRGMHGFTVMGQKQYEFDLEHMPSMIDYGDSQFILTAHGEEVPARLQELIDKFNTIGPQTSFLEVVSWSRRFLALHPMTDSNGKLALMLLDAGLIRAGYPPIPKSLDTKVGLLLWETDESAAANLSRLYSN